MAKRALDIIEVFDRVRVSKDSDLEYLRGKEGTVAFIGSGGINIVIENYPNPIPVRWSELEKIAWEDFGEE